MPQQCLFGEKWANKNPCAGRASAQGSFMPELAEVEFFRWQWSCGMGHIILRVETHRQTRIFRERPARLIEEALRGHRLTDSRARGKEMLFGFEGVGWLGLHLGMSGSMHVMDESYAAQAHDHFLLRQEERTLVFRDPRQFGRVRWTAGAALPVWWINLAPDLLDESFTARLVAEFCRRHGRLTVKTLLLDQRRFPGIGNWMADEILWRCRIRPHRLAGTLSRTAFTRLHAEIVWVCTHALLTIGETGGEPPADWLFQHRWKDGGRCPRTGRLLRREEIGGRTTCWSPGWQR